MVMMTVQMMVLKPPKIIYTLDILATLDPEYVIFTKLYRPPEQPQPVNFMAPKNTRFVDIMSLIQGIDPLAPKDRKKRGQLSFTSKLERSDA